MTSSYHAGNGAPADPLVAVRPFVTAALLIGDPASASGDPRGCYELYACTTRLLVQSIKGPHAVKQQLETALQQSAALTEADQQERLLRRALDEVAAQAGKPGVSLETAIPAEPLQAIRTYIGLAISIGAPSYNFGDHRGCYEVYACTARMLLVTVEGADEAKKLLWQALERCTTLDDPNQQAWAMRHAFDAVLGAGPDPLEAMQEYLAIAIRIGAPSYNYGDHRGCYEVYACTARLLLQAIEGADEAKKILRKALKRCGTVADVRQQAWIMREAFDTILGDASEAE